MLSPREVLATKGCLTLTPPALSRAVLDRSVQRTLNTSEIIHVAGDPAKDMYGVVFGSVRVPMAAAEHGP